MWVLVCIIAAFYLLLVIMCLITVMLDNQQPVKTLAWILVLLISGLGLLLYYFFGQNIRRERIFSKKNFNLLLRDSVSHHINQATCALSERYEPLALMMKRISYSQPLYGQTTNLFTQGSDFFIHLLSDIYKATNHIHLDFFIFSHDSIGQLIGDALIDAAKRGVEVRIIYDDVGSWLLSRKFLKRLRKAGIQLAPFQPVYIHSLSHRINYRNHRKLVVIDGITGYVGGMNVALRYIKGTGKGTWYDLQARISGNAVYGIQQLFIADWYYATKEHITKKAYYPDLKDSQENSEPIQIVMSAPFGAWAGVEMALANIIQSARKYIYIQTPYFMPTEIIVGSLQTAALKGVKVMIMIPNRPDNLWMKWANESFYGDVIKAGVEIWTYLPGMMHAKMITVDDEFCSIGSANIDFRSLSYTFESSAFIYSEKVAKKLRLEFEHTMKDCQHITHHMWQKRKRSQRLLQSFVRIFSPLF